LSDTFGFVFSLVAKVEAAVVRYSNDHTVQQDNDSSQSLPTSLEPRLTSSQSAASIGSDCTKSRSGLVCTTHTKTDRSVTDGAGHLDPAD